MGGEEEEENVASGDVSSLDGEVLWMDERRAEEGRREEGRRRKEGGRSRRAMSMIMC